MSWRWLVFFLVLLTGCATSNEGQTETAEEPGPQIGDPVGAFYVNDCTGPAAGSRLCYRCRYGPRPVTAVFVREIRDDMAPLLEKIDEKVAAHQDEKLAAFLVLVTDHPAPAEGALVNFAEEHEVGHTPLTVFEGAEGPASYNLDPGAEITVLVWNHSRIRAVHVLSADDLEGPAVERVLADIENALP